MTEKLGRAFKHMKYSL